MSGINIHAQEVQEQQLNSDGHDFILAPDYKRGGGGSNSRSFCMHPIRWKIR